MIARSRVHRGHNGSHSGNDTGTTNGNGGGAKESATNPDIDLNQSLLKNSLLYREFQAEREEILKHKWIESEKAGRDIGFERALTDWIVRYRSGWRRTRERIRHPVSPNDFKKES